MALSSRLLAYLGLEREMIRLDDAADPLADEIRDELDKIWYRLDERDRAYLDRRHIGEFGPIHEAVDLESLRIEPPSSPAYATTRSTKFFSTRGVL